MPLRRTPEDSARPPLARGSACHRCFARKVRCSGQPDPATGMHACAACLRTARFKGHDLAHCRCAFGAEGLCSEEGGPNLLGEIYPNAGPAPRRRLTSRSSTSNSSRSLTSLASTSSSGTDVSRTSSSNTSLDSPLASPAMPISPVAPTQSGGPHVNGGEKLFALPRATPALYQPAPAPLTFELPPPLPLYVPVPGLAPPSYAPSLAAASAPHPDPPRHPFQATHASSPHHSPGTGLGDDPSRCTSPRYDSRLPPQRPALPGATNTCPKSLLARRSKVGPMSIPMPPPPGSTISPAGSRSSSRATSPVRAAHVGQVGGDPNARDAAQGGDRHGSYRSQNHGGHVPGLMGLPTASAVQATGLAAPFPHTELPGASHPGLTGQRSHLDNLGVPTHAVDAFPAYMSGAPSPGLLIPMGGFHSSLHLPLDPRQPVPAYAGFHMSHLDQVSSSAQQDQGPFSGSVQVPAPSPSHHLAHGAEGIASAGTLGLGDLTDWTGSFHLYSPGLTFSSSAPQWFAQSGT
ncbi:hypothetical protein JCM3774_006439 [Rhodotorula dairenensis]